MKINLNEFICILLDEYEWKYDNCYLPPDEELVIYELHVGDFSGGENDPLARGTFKHVTEKIDYLIQLGVNASMTLFCCSKYWFRQFSVELMPIKEYPGNHSW